MAEVVSNPVAVKRKRCAAIATYMFDVFGAAGVGSQAASGDEVVAQAKMHQDKDSQASTGAGRSMPPLRRVP